VQLHVIQELWDLLPKEEKEGPIYDTYDPTDQSAQLCLPV
jgi:hypothetical protein